MNKKLALATMVIVVAILLTTGAALAQTPQPPPSGSVSIPTSTPASTPSAASSTSSSTGAPKDLAGLIRMAGKGIEAFIKGTLVFKRQMLLYIDFNRFAGCSSIFFVLVAMCAWWAMSELRKWHEAKRKESFNWSPIKWLLWSGGGILFFVFLFNADGVSFPNALWPEELTYSWIMEKTGIWPITLINDWASLPVLLLVIATVEFLHILTELILILGFFIFPFSEILPKLGGKKLDEPVVAELWVSLYVFWILQPVSIWFFLMIFYGTINSGLLAFVGGILGPFIFALAAKWFMAPAKTSVQIALAGTQFGLMMNYLLDLLQGGQIMAAIRGQGDSGEGTTAATASGDPTPPTPSGVRTASMGGYTFTLDAQGNPIGATATPEAPTTRLQKMPVAFDCPDCGNKFVASAEPDELVECRQCFHQIPVENGFDSGDPNHPDEWQKKPVPVREAPRYREWLGQAAQVAGTVATVAGSPEVGAPLTTAGSLLKPKLAPPQGPNQSTLARAAAASSDLHRRTT